jgi:RecA-family ATPase
MADPIPLEQKALERGQKFLDSQPKLEGWRFPAAISCDEWETSRLAPDCIVENYLYGDVGALFAPGGTGKTTLILWEAAHIALGLPLWGNEIKKPGPTLIVTAEDSREMLIARLRRIAEAMALTSAQIAVIRDQIRIRESFEKLTLVIADVVVPSSVVNEIIAECKKTPTSMIVIDPAVSFGVGEARVNDAEQGLVEVGRLFRNALGSAVRFVHHTGKQNARDKALDQYAGRGGSALSDGARMITVLQGGWSSAEWQKRTGQNLEPDEQGLILARPKLSYTPPQPEIYLVRRGYEFIQVNAIEHDAGLDLRAQQDQVWRLISTQLKEGHFHSARTVSALAPQVDLTRQQIRDAVNLLLASGRLEKVKRPNGEGHGEGRFYLNPVESQPGGK